jgi:hypothetical protein
MTLQGIRLDPDGGDVVCLLHMIDISKSGMGACSDRAFYRGQRIVLNLPGAPAGLRRNVAATVVRCLPDREHGFQVGMEFDAIPSANWVGGSRPAVAAA